MQIFIRNGRKKNLELLEKVRKQGKPY